MPRKLFRQLRAVAERILTSSLDDVIAFAQSVPHKLTVDALVGLARAVDMYLNGKRIDSFQARRLQVFCQHASEAEDCVVFAREYGFIS